MGRREVGDRNASMLSMVLPEHSDGDATFDLAVLRRVICDMKRLLKQQVVETDDADKKL